jgi:hypothetical protein
MVIRSTECGPTKYLLFASGNAQKANSRTIDSVPADVFSSEPLVLHHEANAR